MTEVANPLGMFVSEVDGVDPYTITRSGHRFYYGRFTLDDIILHDIIDHLSSTNRWIGALRTYYSTAQHSVVLARYAMNGDAKQFPEPLRTQLMLSENLNEGWKCMLIRKTFAMALLFHDGEEYVTGDFPGSIKQFFPLFILYGNYVREMIFEKYNIPYKYYGYCKEWDRRILFNEAEWALCGGRAAIHNKGDKVVATLPIKLSHKPAATFLSEGWTAEKAAEEFRAMYMRLV